MTFQADIAGAQIDGARDYQEDAFLITNLTDADGNPSALIIVADGMGGHAAGNVASNMAVQAFNKSITSLYPADNPSEALNVSILKANASIAETVKETPALNGMGCTFIGVIIEEEKLWWVSVGDSHLYLLRDRKLTKLNDDHSYGGFLDRMEAAGTPVDAEPGLARNMLMSAVIGEDIAEIDCPPTPFILEHDDKLVVCSDGMDALSEGKIIQYSNWVDSSKECAEALMDAVEDAAMPRQDNTTAVVVKIIDNSQSASSVLEDDDITTPPAANADATAEIEISPETNEDEVVVETSEVEIAAEVPAESIDLTPDEAPIEMVASTDRATSDDSEKSKNPGLFIGIAASVLVALIAGGYFMFGGSKTDKPGDQIASEEIASDEAVSDETISQKSSSEENTEVAEVSDEATILVAEKTIPEPAPTSEPEAATQAIVEPVSTGKKEFQDSLKDGGTAPMMVVIPAGSFEMGSPSSSRFTDERPRHTVKIQSFAVNKYEVTFAEYDKFAIATKREPPNDLHMDRETHPAVFVKWDDAHYYTKWLSEQTGKNYRLLSESEWEYAASGGKKTPFWWGYDEEPNRAHCFGCETGLDPRKPAKIGSFAANPFGIHDTAGNVSEWVSDCWHENYDGAPSDNEVWEGGDCAYRILRGGAYISPAQSIRSAKRDKLKSDAGYDHVGIRIARELD